MAIDTTFLRRCLSSLEFAVKEIKKNNVQNTPIYDIYRAACVKEFELVLEQSGKLLKKRIAGYFSSNRQVDVLTFKELFRHAAKYGLIDITTAERWFSYRDNRNSTAHDYGEHFAELTLKLLPMFIRDAEHLANIIETEVD